MPGHLVDRAIAGAEEAGLPGVGWMEPIPNSGPVEPVRRSREPSRLCDGAAAPITGTRQFRAPCGR